MKIDVNVHINHTKSSSVAYPVVDPQGRLVEARHELQVAAVCMIVAPQEWREHQGDSLDKVVHAAAYELALYIVRNFSVRIDPEKVEYPKVVPHA